MDSTSSCEVNHSIIMNYFFLDIASHDGLLAYISSDGVISSREVSTRIRDHELIPLAEECLKEAKWEYQDLDRIVCVVGPGGFTSLRVAVSFSNTLMDQLDIEGVGVGLWDLYRVRGSGIGFWDTLWLHSTKKDSLFTQGGKWREPTLTKIEDLLENRTRKPNPIKWMGELLDSHKEELASLELKEAQLKPVIEILPEFIKNLSYSKKPLEPWYGRSG